MLDGKKEKMRRIRKRRKRRRRREIRTRRKGTLICNAVSYMYVLSGRRWIFIRPFIVRLFHSCQVVQFPWQFVRESTLQY
jgi:hypothetical protein